MIITCENCAKSFNIQDSLIPNEGRETTRELGSENSISIQSCTSDSECEEEICLIEETETEGYCVIFCEFDDVGRDRRNLIHRVAGLEGREGRVVAS